MGDPFLIRLKVGLFYLVGFTPQPYLDQITLIKNRPRTGGTEAAICDIFERAQKFAPAVILFDEVDSRGPAFVPRAVPGGSGLPHAERFSQ